MGIGVYVIKDGKILLGERVGSFQANTFCAPGGHLEYGESWEECARRETFEEAGIKIKNLRFLGVVNDIMGDNGGHYVTIQILADYDSGEPTRMEPNKFLSWDWYSYDEIPERKSAFLENFLKSEFAPKLKELIR